MNGININNRILQVDLSLNNVELAENDDGSVVLVLTPNNITADSILADIRRKCGPFTPYESVEDLPAQATNLRDFLRKQ